MTIPEFTRLETEADFNKLLEEILEKLNLA